ncbi:MAG TPA: Gfo/Idh/MocA family oxidoreductase [Chloroflexota bacterium]|jgi:predicted dehydrogenase|nr:Gfo/Idh/MocA family oxidoreductase [Chloroflexota bacterium]
MAGKRLRVGMIGCGDVGERSALGLRDAEHTELAGVMDVNEALAHALGEAFDVPWTCDLAELLARPDVDAVYVAVPNFLLASVVVQAAQAGKHVLCEKPMATSLTDADRMLAACAQAGVALGVAFEAQLTPEIQRLHELIASGAIGTVIGTRIIAMLDKPNTYWAQGYEHRTATDWRASKARAGGGMLITTHIHDINTVRYLTGLEARRIYAEYGTFVTPVEVEDLAFVTIRYDNGAIGSIEGSSCIKGNGMALDVGNYIYGTAGQVIQSDTLRIYTTLDVPGLPAETWHEIGKPHTNPEGRIRVMEGFATAVLAGRPVPVSGHDGRAALEVALSAYQAGAQGRPVDVGTGQVR